MGEVWDLRSRREGARRFGGEKLPTWILRSLAEAAANKSGINLAILRRKNWINILLPFYPSISETSINCSLTCGQGTTAAGLVDRSRQQPGLVQAPITSSTAAGKANNTSSSLVQAPNSRKYKKKIGQKSKFSFLGWTNVESQDFYIFFWYFVGLIRTVAKQVACSVTWNQSVDSALQWQTAQHCRWLLNIVVQSNHCWNAGCLLEMRTLLELYKGTKTSPVTKGWVVMLTYG